MLATLLAAFLLAQAGPPGAAAPPSGSAAPAGGEAARPPQETLSALRKSCYGGRGEPLPAIARADFLQRFERYFMQKRYPRAVHWLRRALQGGEDEIHVERLIGVLIRLPEESEASAACVRLVERLRAGKPGPPAGPTPPGREPEPAKPAP